MHGSALTSSKRRVFNKVDIWGVGLYTGHWLGGRGVLALRRICEKSIVGMVVLVGTCRDRLLQGNLESWPAPSVRTRLLTWILVGRLLQENWES
jgi:hypothetical protein